MESADMIKTDPLWTPSEKQIADSRLTEFSNWVEARAGRKFASYEELHAWSCDSMDEFWDCIWEFCGIVGEKGDRLVVDGDRMPGARFFPDASINFAENLLKFEGEDDAIVFRCEDKVNRRMNRNELRALVSRLQQAFSDAGIGVGDRIGAMMPNMPETIAAMLAASSLGAIWSSCSPDFGVQGVLDRFGQIEPKLLISCDGYWYNGKRIEVGEKLKEIASSLKCEKTIVVPLLGDADKVAANVGNGTTMDNFVESFQPKELHFERLGFSHPLYILFSSGTTGVHGRR